MREKWTRRICWLSFLFFIQQGAAYWPVTLHPKWAEESAVTSMRYFCQGGWLQFDSKKYAVVWFFDRDYFIWLHPDRPEITESVLTAMTDDIQVGYSRFSDGSTHAGAWQWDYTNWQDYHPHGVSGLASSYITCLNLEGASQKGGYVTFADGHDEAVVWDDGPASCRRLHDSRFHSSRIYGTIGDRQFGWVKETADGPTKAYIWNNTASGTMVHPPVFYESAIVGADPVTGGSVGHVRFYEGFPLLSGRWDPSPTFTFYLMNPSRGLESRLYASHFNQVGETLFSGRAFPTGVRHQGSPDPVEDLYDYVDRETYEDSKGFSIYSITGVIFIGGQAFNKWTRQKEAYAWFYDET